MRLIGGTDESNGHVEICRQRTWGVVCSDGWDDRDAEVVCRQLGFDPSGIMLAFLYFIFMTVITPQMQMYLKQLRHQRKFQSLLAKWSAKDQRSNLHTVTVDCQIESAAMLMLGVENFKVCANFIK